MTEADSAQSAARDSERLGALRHGLAVLDLFDMQRQTITPTEIARHLGIHKSTASRIASNLVLSGFLVPGPTGSGYSLSGKLSRLGAIAAAKSNLSGVAAEHVQALVDDVGETCHVGVLEGNEAVTVMLINGSYSVRLHSFVGKRNDAHTTAMGKALLAAASDAALDALYPDEVLPTRTERTLATVSELKQELARIRTAGFAVDDEELEPGLRCVAAPIVDHEHNVIAALTIAAASSRLTKAKIEDYAAKVRTTALRISAGLGAPDGNAYHAVEPRPA